MIKAVGGTPYNQRIVQLFRPILKGLLATDEVCRMSCML